MSCKNKATKPSTDWVGGWQHSLLGSTARTHTHTHIAKERESEDKKRLITIVVILVKRENEIGSPKKKKN